MLYDVYIFVLFIELKPDILATMAISCSSGRKVNLIGIMG